MKKARTHNSRFVAIIRALILLAIIAVLGWFGYLYAGRLLCRTAIGQIAQLTGTRINAGAINYKADGSVFIDNLVVKPLGSDIPDTEIIRAKKVFARFDRKSLFLLKPRLNAIDVKDFVFSAAYDVNTGWSNLSDLVIRPTGRSARKIPNINLVAGTLRYVKLSNGHQDVSLSVPVEADFTSDEQIPRQYSFNITTAAMSSGYGQSHLHGTWKPGDVTITGGIASLSVPDFEMACMIDVLAAELKYDKSDDYSLVLSVKNMQALRSDEQQAFALEMPSFVRKYGFFSTVQAFLDTYKPKGLADFDLKMSGNLRTIASSQLEGSVNCRDVAFNYSGFQYPIDHVAGQINFNQDEFSFSNLKGKHGDTEVSFDGWYSDFGPKHEYKFNVASDRVTLDDDLYDALTENERKLWTYFAPLGDVSVNLAVERHPETGRTMNLQLGLLDVDAVYRSFPYPLKNLNGTLLFSRNKVVVRDVVSKNGRLKVALNGNVLDYWNDNAIYDIGIDVNNVPLDSTLEAALSKNQKRLYERLKPLGTFDGSIQLSTPDAGGMDYVADLNFKDSTMKLDSLEKPVSDISAHAVIKPDLVVIRDFSGLYGGIPVSLTGQVMCDNEEDLRYDVSLNVNRIRLNNEEMAGLLPESMNRIVSRFDPNGEVNLTADLKKDDAAKPVDYRVTVDCLGNDINLDGFPYPLTDVKGSVRIVSDKIDLENISADLGDSAQEAEKARLVLNGEIGIADGLLSSADLKISARKLRLDECFAQLIPKHCRGLYNVLSPSGCIDIDLDNLSFVRRDNDEKTVDVKGSTRLGSCDFIMAGRRARLDAAVEIQGAYVSGKGFSNCRLLVDDGTLSILGKTLTALKTEIHYDPNCQTWSSDELLANLYGGRTTGNFQFIQRDGSPMEYVLQTAFADVDLKEFMADTKLSDKRNNTLTTGKMSGSLDLSSEVAENASRIGACRVTIENMQVGKMSPLANILQVLNLNEPCDYAFDSMFIDSYIRRDGLVVQKLDMSGKSVAFYGSGSIDLSDGGVDLSLIARGHRLATDDPSLLQSLTEGLGQAVVRMDVTGDYRNIKVATRALPVLEGTLQILGTKPSVTN